MRRCLVVAVCLLATAIETRAQDFEMPTLRGTAPYIPAPPVYTRWSGVYGGGQLGIAILNTDFSSAFSQLNIFDSGQPLTAPFGRVSSWASLGNSNRNAGSYGGFIGYNSQWEDAVFGIELSYNRSSMFASASDSRCYSQTNANCHAAITLGDANTYNATVNATASARITDYGSLRGRAAWSFGNFLPYALAGVAVGRAQVVRSATANATPTSTGTAFVHTEIDSRIRFTWGYALGGGLDFLIMPNVFVRGEYEYIHFNPVGNIDLSVSTARVGAGLKF